MTIGQFIVNREARRDSSGRLAVYRLPAGDGGGTFEVAGINDRYHEHKARQLARLIESGRHEEAEQVAVAYVEFYTLICEGWHPDPRVAEFLRDCVFNRGAGGAAKILQHAIGVTIDGQAGPKTKAAAAKHAAEDLIFRLLLSRQWYERCVVGRNESSPFWSGLVNRWVDAAQFALKVGDPETWGK